MQTTTLHAVDRGDSDPRVQRSKYLGALATQALIAEAELTPKPGLVDRRGSGAHHDLSLGLMKLSATVLEPYFVAMASLSAEYPLDTNLRTELASIGRRAERAMYQATHGSNAHKGAIWLLGLLVSASAYTEAERAPEIAAVAGTIARLPDRALPELITHGDMMQARYGVTGARGEAHDDFSHVVDVGLPTLRARRRDGASEQVCRLDTLLNLMSQVDDTCVLYRGGMDALNTVKHSAYTILAAGGYGTAEGRRLLVDLDRELVARSISPGGSADLLAASLYLDAVENRHPQVHRDHSQWEERDGKA